MTRMIDMPNVPAAQLRILNCTKYVYMCNKVVKVLLECFTARVYSCDGAYHSVEIGIPENGGS